jgi:LPS sulfotransferase NodH
LGLPADGRQTKDWRWGHRVQMTEITEDLLEAMKDTRILRHLSRAGDGARIIAPEAVLDRIRALNPACPAIGANIDPVSGAPLNIYVWDAETGSLSEVRQRFRGNRVIGIFRDVWPATVTRTRPLANVPEPLPVSHGNFVILCVPRSGSNYLCELLQASGLGQPAEHLRDLFIALYSRGWPAGLLMQRFMARGIRNGVFGTKIVSNFLLRDGPGSPLCYSMEGWLKQNNFHVVLLRRDTVEQAVSAYFAQTTAVWHSTDPQSLAGHHDVAYDFAAIASYCRSFIQSTLVLEEMVRRFPSVTVVDYDELDRSPHEVVRRIHRALGEPAGFNPQIDTSSLTQKISASVPLMGAYIERFRAEAAEHHHAV